MNLGAQAEQASEWKAESALEKARKAKIEDYRTQKGIDAEIATASDEKKRAHEVSMLEKTQQAQREVIKAQQDFTAAQNDKERAEAWKRLESAQNHAVNMQNTALAATAAEGAAGRQLQTDIANLRTRSDDFLARNAVHFGPNGMYSRGSDIFMTTTPMPDKSGKMPLPESIPLTGPRGQGEQVPQISIGGTAPSMGAVTPARSALPSMLPPGDGVRLRRDVSEAVTPSDGDDVYRQNVITQPRAKATRTTTEEPPAEVPKPSTATPPAASEETGEEVQGLIPAVGEYLSSGESPSLAQEAPVTAESRKGFMTALGDVGRSLSEGARSVKPLLMGGKLPRYSQDQGGNVLGMLLNAPGAILSPVEYGLNTVLRNPTRAWVQGVDPSTSQPVRTKLQDPNTMYMSDAEYKNYLRRQKLNNY